MRIKKLLIAIGLAALATASLFLISGKERPAAATDERLTRPTWELTHTIYLPWVARHHLLGYVPPFGIVMYGNVNDAAGLQTMENAGSKWVTTKLSWSAIEPTQDNYDWSSFDTKAQNAQSAGMDVFVLFKDNPSWAAALPGGPVTDTQDLVDFVTDMAERYDCDGVNDAPDSPCVHYWSFYAEPDNGDLYYAQCGKGYWGHNGAGYAEMLSQASPAIHAVNPHARVLIGGLAYDWFEEDGGPFVRSFLTDTLSALNEYPGGPEAYIDAVAFHYYPISKKRWPTIREKALEVRGIMERHDADGLALICPEMGIWSSPKFGSSEQNQAQRLVQMYARGLSVDMQPLSWYKVFDAAEPNSAEDLYPDRTSGLLDVYGQPKQSYYAYQTMTQELAYARYLRELEATDAEGYVFQMSDGYKKTVLWATASSTTVQFPYSCLRRVDVTGGEQTINDGGAGDSDGSGNGKITLTVYEDAPVYVEPCH